LRNSRRCIKMDLDERLEQIEIEGREVGWRDEMTEEHNRLTVQLVSVAGSRTKIRDESPGCPTVTARTRKVKGIPLTYDDAARNRSIRYDYIYMGMTVSELASKWKLSERHIRRALGSMREVGNRRARWQNANRRR